MIDYNCMIGHWPFYKTRRSSMDQLKSLHEAHGVTAGYLSSLYSVFYHDPFEGDKELALLMKGQPFKMVISMNLNLPCIDRDIRMAKESFSFEGIRIYPSLHGYELTGNAFDEFLQRVKEEKKKLFISCRMGDNRLDYLLRQKVTDVSQLQEVLKNKYENDIYLLNLTSSEVLTLKEDFKGHERVFFDSSDVRHETFAMRKFNQEGLTEKCVFGSFFPIYEFESTYLVYRKTY